MADNFSLEDILKEYSGKVPNRQTHDKSDNIAGVSINSGNNALGTSQSVLDSSKHNKSMESQRVIEPNSNSILSDDIPDANNALKKASEDTIGLQIKLGVKPTQNIQPVISEKDETQSAVADMSVTALIDKAVGDIEESSEKKLVGSSIDEKDLKIQDIKNHASILNDNEENLKQGNTAIIERLVKMRKKKVVVSENNGTPPISRAKPSDIDMGLTGKILPHTAPIDIDNPNSNSKHNNDSSDSAEALKNERKKKVDDFVLQSQENDETEEITEHIDEYSNFDQTSAIASDISQLKNNLVVRFVVLLVTTLMSAYISIANDFSLPILNIFNRATSPGGFSFTLTALGLISIFVSYTVVLAGLKNLVSLKPDSDIIASIGLTVAVISGIIILIDDELARSGHFHLYISVAILGMVINTVGKIIVVNRTERNFQYVSGEYEKYAVVNVEDEDVALKFTKGALNDYPYLSTMRKTEFVEDFLKNSYSRDISDVYSQKLAPIITVGSLIIAIIGMLLDKNATGILGHIVAGCSVFAGTLTICSSIALMLVVNLPLARASKKCLQSSAVMLGYSSVEEFADTNSVLIGVEQLFPEGMVELVNLKAMSSTNIEDCILMAGSLACQAGSILRPTFYKILKGKTEMLYPVESYIYEDGLGLSGWIENKRVLLGTRELMENHSIEGIPPKNKEKEYANGNLILYLSISGVVSSLFVIRAKASANIANWLQELEYQRTTVVIRSVDSFISLNFLSKLFDVSPETLKLLPFRDYKEYEKQTGYTPKISSSMLCSGHFQSLAMLICKAKNIQLLSFVGITLQLASAILGGVIALIMVLLGSFSQLTASVVLCYNLVWLAVTLVAQQIKRI